MTDRCDAQPSATAEPSSVPDLAPWLGDRATIRDFDPDASIPPEEIREIVDAGRNAPTSGTTQMYSFVWLRDRATRERVHELCGGGTRQVEEAAHFLLVCIDIRRIRRLLRHADHEFGFSPAMALLEGAIDASLAAQASMTIAESRGYGVCPIGNILTNQAAIAREVELPELVVPTFGLCIGVPSEEAPKENCPRVPLSAVLHIDEYDDPAPELLDRCYDRMNALYGGSVYGDRTRTWDETLARYWGPDGFMNEREETLVGTLSQQGFFRAGKSDGTLAEYISNG